MSQSDAHQRLEWGERYTITLQSQIRPVLFMSEEDQP